MSDEKQLPEYEMCTTVRAAKILSTQGARSVWDLYEIELEGTGPTLVSFRNFIERYSVEVGGYLVQYADGHTGYLPADTFEDVYQPRQAPQPVAATRRRPKSLPPVPADLATAPTLPAEPAPEPAPEPEAQAADATEEPTG